MSEHTHLHYQNLQLGQATAANQSVAMQSNWLFSVNSRNDQSPAVTGYAKPMELACNGHAPSDSRPLWAQSATLPAELAPIEAKLKSINAEVKAASLSQREFQLLELMAQGCSNKEIVHRLFLSTGTVKSYSSRMFDKLCVRGRTQAVVHALNAGLIPSASPR